LFSIRFVAQSLAVPFDLREATAILIFVDNETAAADSFGLEVFVLVHFLHEDNTEVPAQC
jgi:hypothetical protein